MYIDEETRAYEKIFHECFSTVFVRGRSDGEKDIEVYNIPDDKMAEFMDFVIDVLPSKLEAVGLKFDGIIPHNKTSTGKIFLEAYRMLGFDIDESRMDFLLTNDKYICHPYS